MDSWSPEHTNLVLLGIAVASEVIAVSPLKSNSIAQLILGLLRGLVGAKGTKGAKK